MSDPSDLDRFITSYYEDRQRYPRHTRPVPPIEITTMSVPNAIADFNAILRNIEDGYTTAELRLIVRDLIRDAFTAGYTEAGGWNIPPFDGGHEQADAYLKQLYGASQ
jgi:hypothetical protein